jgi:hypothetical protein
MLRTGFKKREKSIKKLRLLKIRKMQSRRRSRVVNR